jgi:sugar lactone lactonase YvrE
MPTTLHPLDGPIQALGPAAELGESPVWCAESASLYWCDIEGRRVQRLRPDDGAHASWSFDTEPACCALGQDGRLRVACRDGLWALDMRTGLRERLANAPYDVTAERFNDGRCDASGRWWIGTLRDRREAPAAALYRWSAGRLARMAGEVTVSNGLAFSPDQRTLYWADTTAHTIYALDHDPATGELGPRRVFARFAPKPASGDLQAYGGRPDGAAVDAEGHLWVACFEGARLVRFSPAGALTGELSLPVRCPTMPCFGGHDLRTLYITTARHGRPAHELSAQPWAGQVLSLRVEVPGLPAARIA